MVFIFLWITSLSLIISSYIHVAADDIISFFFWLSSIPSCVLTMHHLFFIHSSVSGHVACFHVLAIVSSATMDIWVYASFWTRVLSGYMPRIGIAGSYGNSIFSFLRCLFLYMKDKVAGETSLGHFIFLSKFWIIISSSVYNVVEEFDASISDLLLYNKVFKNSDLKQCAKSLQSCLTLCNPMDCSLPGSSVHGLLQVRILEWVAMLSSRGIFLTQDSNAHLLCLLLWHVGSLPLAPPEHLLSRNLFRLGIQGRLCWVLPAQGPLQGAGRILALPWSSEVLARVEALPPRWLTHHCQLEASSPPLVSCCKGCCDSLSVLSWQTASSLASSSREDQAEATMPFMSHMWKSHNTLWVILSATVVSDNLGLKGLQGGYLGDCLP